MQKLSRRGQSCCASCLCPVPDTKKLSSDKAAPELRKINPAKNSARVQLTSTAAREDSLRLMFERDVTYQTNSPVQ